MKTIDYKGYKITIEKDSDAPSPLEWQDEKVVLVSYQTNRLGFCDKDYIKLIPNDCVKQLQKNGFVVYDIFFSVQDKDIYQVKAEGVFFGYLGVNPSVVEETKRTEVLDGYVVGLLEDYTAWVNGEVFYLSIEDPDGEEIDSCGDCYDKSQIIYDAKLTIDNHIKNRKQFFLVKLGIQNGEYEYEHFRLLRESTTETVHQDAIDLSKGFYLNEEDEVEEDEQWHCHNAGEVRTKVLSIHPVTKKEADFILKHEISV